MNKYAELVDVLTQTNYFKKYKANPALNDFLGRAIASRDLLAVVKFVEYYTEYFFRAKGQEEIQSSLIEDVKEIQRTLDQYNIQHSITIQ